MVRLGMLRLARAGSGMAAFRRFRRAAVIELYTAPPALSGRHARAAAAPDAVG